MDKTTHEVRLAYRKDIARKCQTRPEGQTTAAWLEENGIHNKQYYYWLHQIRGETCEGVKTSFLPVASNHDEVAFAEIPFSGSEPASRHRWLPG